MVWKLTFQSFFRSLTFMIIIHSSVPFISLQPLTVVAAIQLCVAVKTLYLMSIYTGTMRLNLMFHHLDHCWCARGGGRDNHPCVLPGDTETLATRGMGWHWHCPSLRGHHCDITPTICNAGGETWCGNIHSECKRWSHFSSSRLSISRLA